MEEYYDRYIRNDNHLQKTINYILNNPANAGLDDWPWVGVRSTGFQPVLQARVACIPIPGMDKLVACIP